jgi:hypothetical protein
MTDKELAAFIERLAVAQAKDDAMTPEEVAAWEKLQNETLPEAPPIPGEDDDSVIAVFLKKRPDGRAKRTQKN